MISGQNMNESRPQIELCRGYLYKKSTRGLRRWKMYHFRWDGKLLSYHSCEKQDSIPIRGYAVSNIKEIILPQKVDDPRRYTFKIEFGDKTPSLLLGVKTSALRDNWVRVLSLGIQCTGILACDGSTTDQPRVLSGSKDAPPHANGPDIIPAASPLDNAAGAEASNIRILSKLCVRRNTFSACSPPHKKSLEKRRLSRFFNRDRYIGSRYSTDSQLKLRRVSQSLFEVKGAREYTNMFRPSPPPGRNMIVKQLVTMANQNGVANTHRPRSSAATRPRIIGQFFSDCHSSPMKNSLPVLPSEPVSPQQLSRQHSQETLRQLCKQHSQEDPQPLCKQYSQEKSQILCKQHSQEKSQTLCRQHSQEKSQTLCKQHSQEKSQSICSSIVANKPQNIEAPNEKNCGQNVASLTPHSPTPDVLPGKTSKPPLRGQLQRPLLKTDTVLQKRASGEYDHDYLFSSKNVLISPLDENIVLIS